MKKTFFFSLLVGSLALGLVGCGSSGDKESSKKSSKNTITIMASGVNESKQGVFLNNLKKMVEESDPDYTVEVTSLPDDQYYTALKSKLSTGQAPDIFLVQPKKAGANSVESMAKAGYIESLDDLKNWDNLLPQAKEDMSLDGKPYALSSTMNLLGTWYNKSLFEENNLEVPKNWSEFLEVCEVLKNKGVTPIVMGDKDSFMIQFGMYQVAANQVYPNNMNFDNQLYTGETKFTDDEWVKTISMYKELYDKGYMSDKTLSLGQTQAQQMFVEEKAAMIFDGDFSVQALSTDNFEVGLMPLPANDSGETFVSAAIGGGWAISSQSENKEKIKEIFNLMTDGESDLYNEWKSIASLSTFKEADETGAMYEEFEKAMVDKRSIYFSNQAWPAGTENEMQAKFSEMIGTGKLSAKEVAEAMQKKFEELNTK